jgi:hypothetical protein
MSAEPKIVIIAGPNGAGKTTFAQAFLPREAQCPRFINADLIAAGLSPFAPEAAPSSMCRRYACPDKVVSKAKFSRRATQAEISCSISRPALNFENHYRAAVDAWAVYDNSGDEPLLIEWGERS